MFPWRSYCILFLGISGGMFPFPFPAPGRRVQAHNLSADSRSRLVGLVPRDDSSLSVGLGISAGPYVMWHCAAPHFPVTGYCGRQNLYRTYGRLGGGWQFPPETDNPTTLSNDELARSRSRSTRLSYVPPVHPCLACRRSDSSYHSSRSYQARPCPRRSLSVRPRNFVTPIVSA